MRGGPRSRCQFAPASGILRSPLLSRLIEIFQVGSRLILPSGHQVAVLADVIILLADRDVMVALGADILEPDRLAFPPVVLGHGTRAGQRVVDGRDLVVQDSWFGLLEGDALVD